MRYPGSAAPALSHVSATFPAGSLTVIVGASGAGKTTLGDLLLGLLEPESGTVLVDGRPLRTLVRVQWRDRVGYLAQEPMLLHGTIRENLLFAHAGASEDELREALRGAACDFVDSLPQGLDSAIGERGVLVSGGERQRLALARALLRQPGLLVLDEATSALDAETEQRILATVRALAGRCTVVFCTHREAPRAIADQVIEL
jgi:ATP-binding cassette subfamily C protein